MDRQSKENHYGIFLFRVVDFLIKKTDNNHYFQFLFFNEGLDFYFYQVVNN